VIDYLSSVVFAARIEKLMDSKYYAGIWEKYPIPSLYWYSTSSTLSFHSRWFEIGGVGNDYIAPSWSWVFVRGEIRHHEPAYKSGFIFLVDVEEVKMDILDADPFGQVKGSRLVLIGCVVNYRMV
jgi:hypothetical protein